LSSGADYLHQGGGSLWNKNGSQHDYIEEMDTSNNSLLHQVEMSFITSHLDCVGKRDTRYRLMQIHLLLNSLPLIHLPTNLVT